MLLEMLQHRLSKWEYILKLILPETETWAQTLGTLAQVHGCTSRALQCARCRAENTLWTHTNTHGALATHEPSAPPDSSTEVWAGEDTKLLIDSLHPFTWLVTCILKGYCSGGRALQRLPVPFCDPAPAACWMEAPMRLVPGMATGSVPSLWFQTQEESQELTLFLLSILAPPQSQQK